LRILTNFKTNSHEFSNYDHHYRQYYYMITVLTV